MNCCFSLLPKTVSKSHSRSIALRCGCVIRLLKEKTGDYGGDWPPRTRNIKWANHKDPLQIMSNRYRFFKVFWIKKRLLNLYILQEDCAIYYFDLHPLRVFSQFSTIHHSSVNRDKINFWKAAQISVMNFYHRFLAILFLLFTMASINDVQCAKISATIRTCKDISCVPGDICKETPNGPICVPKSSLGSSCGSILCPTGTNCILTSRGPTCRPDCICSEIFDPVCCLFPNGGVATTQNACLCTECGSEAIVLLDQPCLDWSNLYLEPT